MIISESWIWQANQNLEVGTMQDEIVAHKYSPYIDEDEENKVHETMDGEKEDEEVIWYRLQVTIQRVEGM